MDDFWVQVYQCLLAETKSKRLFAWIPRPWYYFAQPRKVSEFYRHLERNKVRVHYILGGSGYLERKYVASVSKEILRYSFAKPPFPTKRSTYVAVISPYLLNIVIEQNAVSRIDELFESIVGERGLSYQKISRVMNEPTKIRIKLERKAERLERSFGEFFGV